MEKLYDRQYWQNGTTPALNDSNLNDLSQAVDEIDDRVVELADEVLVVVPQIQSYLEQAEDLVEQLETLSQNPPYIGQNGNWYVWDTDTGEYVDSGVDASITVTIADVTALAPDATPYVTNTGTATDPIFHLFIPRGQTGEAGVSPTITVENITGGHRVTITDAEHPSGQSFDVMDGSGTGDMRAAVYDANSAVANAGGIASYVDDAVDEWTSTATVDANGQVAFTGLSDALGYSNPCFENKLVFVTALTKTGSGSNVTLTFTLKGATQGDICKLRVFK